MCVCVCVCVCKCKCESVCLHAHLCARSRLLHSQLCGRVCVRVRLIADTEMMLCLTVTCQLIETTVLFGRGSSAPHSALEGGWEQFITHTGWG